MAIPNKVYSVKQLVIELRNLLESNYHTVWVEGEISGLATPASGHLYFSLKEHGAVIRCAFFRQRQSRRCVVPVDGMRVVVCGQISLYESRGDLQLIVSYLEDAGEGALRRAFEQLKMELSREGLFSEAHKKAIPVYPRNIGVITSPSGAALQDILTTLRRRYPLARVILYPTSVQGVQAATEIVGALKTANLRAETEVILLARGGGSLEDLQPFNEEAVAREIFRSAIPVISGVGHEVDHTIADLVADTRAATPTAAAEAATPDIQELQQKLAIRTNQLHRAVTRMHQSAQQSLDSLRSKLVHPSQKLALIDQRRINFRQRLVSLVDRKLNGKRNHIQHLNTRLRAQSPRNHLVQGHQLLDQKKQALSMLIAHRLIDCQTTVTGLKEKLHIMDPMQTLSRGYAILQNDQRSVVVDPKQTKPGEVLTARLSKGDLQVQVTASDK